MPDADKAPLYTREISEPTLALPLNVISSHVILGILASPLLLIEAPVASVMFLNSRLFLQKCLYTQD